MWGIRRWGSQVQPCYRLICLNGAVFYILGRVRKLQREHCMPLVSNIILLAYTYIYFYIKLSVCEQLVRDLYVPVGCKKLRPNCLLIWSGINLLASSGDAPAISCLKLKRGGKGRPFGRRALGSRSSSKNG